MDGWIGVISDTHGLLRPELAEALEGCSRIVHAGDFGGHELLSGLRRIAPVSAVRGNTDYGPQAAEIPDQRTVDCLDLRIHVLHDVTQLALDPFSEEIDVVVSGHTHRPRLEQNGSVLFLNPGSAGPRRMRLPATMARVWAENGRASAEIVYLL